jgi:hypothetical protein
MQRHAIVALFALAATTFLVACSSAHEPTTVSSGIYDLVVVGEADACSPARETGSMGLVGIVSDLGVLNVAVPDGTGELARVSLLESQAFHAELSLDIPDCAGGKLRRGWTVVGSSRDAFSVAYTEEWSGIEGCTSFRTAMPHAPAADCMAQRMLEYQLAESCAAPCEVRETAAGAVCACE